MKTGVIVARFQTSALQMEDFKLIQYVRGQYDDVVIFLGVSRNRLTQNNPLDFETRKLMIKETFPRIAHIYPIKDQKSDKVWSDILDAEIGKVCKEGEVIIHGCGESLWKTYTGVHTVETTHSLSKTSDKVREHCRKTILGNESFRHGIIWASGYKRPRLLQTVDVAILHFGKVLMGRKSGEEKFRFIGGHVDVTDESFEVAGQREVEEECGGIKTRDYRYVSSHLVNDWRYATEEDKIMTAFFCCIYVSGNPVAKDDIEEVKWFDIKSLTADMIEPEHHPLLNSFQVFNEYRVK